MIYSNHPRPMARTTSARRAMSPPATAVAAASQGISTALEGNSVTRIERNPSATCPQLDVAPLADRIRQRIERRLTGRIRNLHVHVSENAIVLSGQCNTFYTKQLAQHAAMGVMEYERLINNLIVQIG